MKKNNLMKTILATTLLCSVAIPVFASQTSPMTVLYTQPNTYTLTIPAAVDLSGGACPVSIDVYDVNIAPDNIITVKITSGINADANIELSRKGDVTTKAITTIHTDPSAPAIQNNSICATFDKSESKQLYLTEVKDKNGGRLKAGEYIGQLVFSASCKAVD